MQEITKNGFRHGCRSTEQIFTLGQFLEILEKSWDYAKTLFTFCIHLDVLYDMVPRKTMGKLQPYSSDNHLLLFI